MTTKATVVEVSPQMATAWLTMTGYEHQRKPNQMHVQYLAGEMERGTFKQDTAIEFAEIDGHRHLTDGQHRLMAVSRSQKPQRFVVIVREHNDESSIALDYTRTDQGKRRTVSQNYAVLRLDEELALPPTWINALGAAVALINNDWKTAAQYKLHTDDRLQMIRDYAPACDQYIQATAGKPKEMTSAFNRSATLAVGLVTFRYSAEVYGLDKVDDFWSGMAVDDGLRRGDARKLALEHLKKASMTGGGRYKYSNAVTPAYSARFLANCFNAWVRNEEKQFTKVLDATKPMLILGSPFTGK